ncbi:ATP-binding protein [Sinimarinibacterium flocculans]|uniref:Signal transduction histidine-protein kinase/phosphatase MprB n=1 Tax=Sinimarinibacterium flocculans TaxID=985250 RepID=A0A318ED21_9GAMM|nr:ATP-binding protein [Sinimarinibacterium flocculans]PXV70371.1 two-component system sensor histidine kinase BaeS [Sinimarinibacterium flocculans]
MRQNPKRLQADRPTLARVAGEGGPAAEPTVGEGGKPRRGLPLFWKLFAVQLLAAAALLSGVLLLMRQQTATSFAAYVEAHERQRLEDVAERIADQHAQTGDLALAALSVRELRRRALLPPPPADAERRRRRLRAPLTVLDADLRPVAGVPLPPGEALRVPIVDDGVTLGYVARPPLPEWIAPDEVGFWRRQTEALMRAAAIGLPLAALFAALIAAMVLRPLRRLSVGTAALARREFSLRLDADRGDEFDRLAADFNALAAALERYDRNQRQWLADVAHELRTPLAVLRGELEAVLDGVRPAGPAQLQSMQQEVQRLGGLIDDLHLLSLAESGGLPLARERCDINALVLGAVARFDAPLRQAGFALEAQLAEGELMASVDAQRIEQVLANLLGNVLRHAQPSAPVRISTAAADGRVEVRVCDGGPGVPADALPRLFDRLYRVESARSRDGGGTGLGLAICRSIVEAHGGRIEARASAGGGLCIGVELPAAGAGT